MIHPNGRAIDSVLAASTRGLYEFAVLGINWVFMIALLVFAVSAATRETAEYGTVFAVELQRGAGPLPAAPPQRTPTGNLFTTT